MDLHNSINLQLDSNPEDLYFLEIKPDVEKSDLDETSLDKINATYQPYETEPYLEEFLQKKVEENQDLQMFLEQPPDIPLSLPDLQGDLDDINIGQTIQNNDIIPNEICGTADICSATEPQFDCANEFEVYKEFLTFKSPRKNIQPNNKLSNKSIQSTNKLSNKSIQFTNKLSNKSIQSTNKLSNKTIQVNNYLPSKNVQSNNNKDKITDVKKQKALQQTKKSKDSQKVIQDFVHISDRVVPPRAYAVLPPSLQNRHDVISPCRLLPPRVRFGPVQGIKRVISKSEVREIVADSAAMKRPVFFLRDKNGETTLIDISDKDKANWLSLLPVGTYDTANVWLYEENNELYGFTSKYISAKKPLTLGYSKAYADKYKLPTFQPILDLTAHMFASKKWSCDECNRSFTSAALMQRHLDFYHRNEKPQPWRRYRCKQCSNSFGRFYTLKRHMEIYCEKSHEKPEIIAEPVEKPKDESTPINIIPLVDDKLFSDESFQNFTNSLDLSTDLFDTDNIPDFDLSNSSRPESELNLYDIQDKDENSLINDVEFMKFSDKLISNDVNDIDKSKRKLVVSCVFCKQSVLVGKRRQHQYVCNGRRMECKCGRVFVKKRFIQHIYKEHRKDVDSKKDQKIEKLSPEFKKYECEKCQITFKRRGMLVNHLWRVHNIKTAAVPLERRLKHYLCVACPKIYGTAAKRNRHVRLHHPGAEKVRAQCIEGGVVKCEPAACSACPRQYTTRAKLLQHVRMQHPHLAPPSKKKSKTNLRIAN